jgi:RND family efflux transporter MFP subunit
MRYFLFTAVFLFFQMSCKDKKNEILPERQDITESVYASGKVLSQGQYQVFSEISGVLKKQFVAEGSPVAQGQVLFEIENSSGFFNAKNAELMAENANVNANQNKIREVQLLVNQAADKFTNDSLQYYRQMNLWNQGIGSKVELEMRQLAFQNSKRNFQSAQINLKELKRQLALNDKMSKNSLEISKSMGGNAQIRSQFSGVMFKVYKEIGEMVSPQMPLAIVGDSKKYYVELEVDEEDIAKIKLGQSVFLTFESYSDKTYDAKISEIIPLMNERSRTFTVKAILISNPSTLYPNQSVEGNILISTKKKALLIPLEYLDKDNQVTLENGDKRKVKTGLKDFRKVEILEGLSEQDAIILP